MEIVLLSVGKVKESWVQKGIDLYTGRLSHYVPFRQICVPDAKKSRNMDAQQQKDAEGTAMLKLIEPSDCLVLFDEHGKGMTSTKFSQWVNAKMSSGIKRLVLAIGGPFGFSDAVRNRADEMLSMSQMTFTHEMALLFATEQIYRAMTILNHQPYHHE